MGNSVTAVCRNPGKYCSAGSSEFHPNGDGLRSGSSELRVASTDDERSSLQSHSTADTLPPSGSTLRKWSKSGGKKRRRGRGFVDEEEEEDLLVVPRSPGDEEQEDKEVEEERCDEKRHQPDKKELLFARTCPQVRERLLRRYHEQRFEQPLRAAVHRVRNESQSRIPTELHRRVRHQIASCFAAAGSTTTPGSSSSSSTRTSSARVSSADDEDDWPALPEFLRDSSSCSEVLVELLILEFIEAFGGTELCCYKYLRVHQTADLAISRMVDTVLFRAAIFAEKVLHIDGGVGGWSRTVRGSTELNVWDGGSTTSTHRKQHARKMVQWYQERLSLSRNAIHCEQNKARYRTDGAALRDADADRLAAAHFFPHCIYYEDAPPPRPGKRTSKSRARPRPMLPPTCSKPKTRPRVARILRARDGSPIAYAKVKNFLNNLNPVMSNTTLNPQATLQRAYCVDTLRREAVTRHCRAAGMVVIWDAENCTIGDAVWQFGNLARYGKIVAGNGPRHFPDGVWKVYIINAPSWIDQALQIVDKFKLASEVNKEAMVVCVGDGRKELEEFCCEDQGWLKTRSGVSSTAVGGSGYNVDERNSSSRSSSERYYASTSSRSEEAEGRRSLASCRTYDEFRKKLDKIWETHHDPAYTWEMPLIEGTTSEEGLDHGNGSSDESSECSSSPSDSERTFFTCDEGE